MSFSEDSNEDLCNQTMNNDQKCLQDAKTCTLHKGDKTIICGIKLTKLNGNGKARYCMAEKNKCRHHKQTIPSGISKSAKKKKNRRQRSNNIPELSGDEEGTKNEEEEIEQGGSNEEKRKKKKTSNNKSSRTSNNNSNEIPKNKSNGTSNSNSQETPSEDNQMEDQSIWNLFKIPLNLQDNGMLDSLKFLLDSIPFKKDPSPIFYNYNLTEFKELIERCKQESNVPKYFEHSLNHIYNLISKQPKTTNSNSSLGTFVSESSFDGPDGKFKAELKSQKTWQQALCVASHHLIVKYGSDPGSLESFKGDIIYYSVRSNSNKFQYYPIVQEFLDDLWNEFGDIFNSFKFPFRLEKKEDLQKCVGKWLTEWRYGKKLFEMNRPKKFFFSIYKDVKTNFNLPQLTISPINKKKRKNVIEIDEENDSISYKRNKDNNEKKTKTPNRKKIDLLENLSEEDLKLLISRIKEKKTEENESDEVVNDAKSDESNEET